MATASSLIASLETETREESVSPSRLAGIFSAVLSEASASGGSSGMTEDVEERLNAMSSSVKTASDKAAAAQSAAASAQASADSAKSIAEEAKSTIDAFTASGGGGTTDAPIPSAQIQTLISTHLS